MRRRWSPRAFEQGRAVEREKMMTMLEAARWPLHVSTISQGIFWCDGSDEKALAQARACLIEGNAWDQESACLLMLSVARETF